MTRSRKAGPEGTVHARSPRIRRTTGHPRCGLANRRLPPFERQTCHSTFSGCVGLVTWHMSQQQQQQVGVVVVLLPGDLLDHRPETFVRHERVHSIRIPQPNADDRVEVRLEGRQLREKATLVCLRLFGKRSPLWWCFLKSSSCAMNWSTNMRKKRLLRSCPNCELSEAMSRANHSAMQVA